MKTILKIFLAATFLIVGATSVKAQTKIRARPAEPKAAAVSQPQAPAPKQVARDPKGYVWKGGHWETPPRDKSILHKKPLAQNKERPRLGARTLEIVRRFFYQQKQQISEQLTYEVLLTIFCLYIRLNSF